MRQRSEPHIRVLWRSLLAIGCVAAAACGQAVPDQLADYRAFDEGSKQFDRREYSEAAKTLGIVLSHTPSSPLIGRSATLAARAYLEAGAPAEAIETAKRFEKHIGEPQYSVLLAKGAAALNDPWAAALAWQRVYYFTPAGAEAEEARGELDRLRTELGDRFPQVPEEHVLTRAERLTARGRYDDAQLDLESLNSDVARVRVCVLDYHRGRNANAYSCLRQLRVRDAEADAERLYWLVSTARRLGRPADIAIHVTSAAKHVASEWRLKALVAAGNESLLQNRPVEAQRYFRSCAQAFPSAEDGQYCHWKYVWFAHMRRQPQAKKLLREHASRYPESDKAPAALYFAGDRAELKRRYPASYYAILAGATGGEQGSLDWTPAPATQLRVERARLLAAGGFDDFALAELRWAARQDASPQTHVLAYELAQIAAEKNLPERGLRGIKAIFPQYLTTPLESAPQRFWELAYPLPYRDVIEREASGYGIDPFLLAALIRQESEFDRTVVSPARAYGLMQLLPSTAADLARRAGVEDYSREKLFDASVNVRLGTHYLKSLINGFDGRIEPALASYNGGRRRVAEWLTWWHYREPSEFIESIPFTETRNYLLLIRRNQHFYKRIYAAP